LRKSETVQKMRARQGSKNEQVPSPAETNRRRRG
jgi:hypothetical protein